MSSPVVVQGWKITHPLKQTASADVIFSAEGVHGPDIARAEDVADEPKVDGILLTRAVGLSVGIGTADCMPLALLGDDTALLLHVSRKTLVQGLLDNVPDYFKPADIESVYIGPGICAEHFKFSWLGDDVQAFQKRWPEALVKEGDIWQLSLRRAVQSYFDDWGVSSEQIIEDGRCTYEDDELSSYREALDSKVPRLATVIASV